MPWYWTDDIAEFLQDDQSTPEEVVARLRSVPTGVRRTEESLEAAAVGMLEDDEIPLAA